MTEQSLDRLKKEHFQRAQEALALKNTRIQGHESYREEDLYRSIREVEIPSEISYIPETDGENDQPPEPAGIYGQRDLDSAFGFLR